MSLTKAYIGTDAEFCYLLQNFNFQKEENVRGRGIKKEKLYRFFLQFLHLDLKGSSLISSLPSLSVPFQSYFVEHTLKIS
jgi:hypothetical protein